MNDAHVHLIFNHLPLGGSIMSMIVLLAGLIYKNQVIKNTAFSLIILSAICAIPVFLTGEGAEEILESINQDNRHFIHEHEETAEKAFWILEATALLSIASLITINKNKNAYKYFQIATVILAIISSMAMIYTGNTGGQIRHTEIR